MASFLPPIPPSPGTSDKTTAKLREVEYGDGYTQSSPDGLNHLRKELSLTWEKLLPEQAKYITDFLAARGGYEPFQYAPSNSPVTYNWTCKEWTDDRIEQGFRRISAVFIQSYVS
jgi:phage-related protein